MELIFTNLPSNSQAFGLRQDPPGVFLGLSEELTALHSLLFLTSLSLSFYVSRL